MSHNELEEICKTCDIDRMKEELEKYPDLVNQIFDGEKNNLLTLFIKNCPLYQNRYIDIIKLLLEKGVDINYTKREKFNALDYLIDLHYVDICDEYVKVVKCLIDNGININKSDDSWDSPLLSFVFIASHAKYIGCDDGNHQFGWSNNQLNNAMDCVAIIENALLNAEKKKWKAELERRLAEQKEQLLHEIYAPDGSSNSEHSGIGYQAAKDRFNKH